MFPGYYRKEFCSTSPKYRSTLIKIKIYVYLFIFEMGTQDFDWEGQKLTFAYKATPNFTFGLILFWVQDAKLFCAKDIRHFNGTMTFGITNDLENGICNDDAENDDSHEIGTWNNDT
jgi:hypothetical protein